MKKCSRVKNPCKICFQTVNNKTGVQCKGACKKWVHFSCLEYTPGKIQDIKAGLITITCPCPNCNTQRPKETLTKPPFTCTHTQCPANKIPTCEVDECPINKNKAAVMSRGIPPEDSRIGDSPPCGPECYKSSLAEITRNDQNDVPPCMSVPLVADRQSPMRAPQTLTPDKNSKTSREAYAGPVRPSRIPAKRDDSPGAPAKNFRAPILREAHVGPPGKTSRTPSQMEVGAGSPTLRSQSCACMSTRTPCGPSDMGEMVPPVKQGSMEYNDTKTNAPRYPAAPHQPDAPNQPGSPRRPATPYQPGSPRQPISPQRPPRLPPAPLKGGDCCRSCSDSLISLNSKENKDKILLCTIQQLCSTVGHLSGQIKDLMCKMMTN